MNKDTVCYMGYDLADYENDDEDHDDDDEDYMRMGYRGMP